MGGFIVQFSQKQLVDASILEVAENNHDGAGHVGNWWAGLGIV